MRRFAVRSFLAASFAALFIGGLSAVAHARAGGGHSYSGGSHSSSGGSYSGGHSYSGGSSYRGRSSDGEAVEALITFIAWGFRTNPIGMILLFSVLGVVIYYGHDGATMGYSSYRDGAIRRGLRVQSDANLRLGLEALKTRDPQFDVAGLLARVRTAFLTVQEAWSNHDLKTARAFLTDGVFERFTVQIEMQQARGIRNVMTSVQVLDAEILQIESGAVFDAVHVSVTANALDGDVSIADGSVVRGAYAEDFTEVWTFLRRRSARTTPKPGAIEGFCPNCGAPLDVVDAAQCASCKSWVNSGEHDWVLAKITQSCEWGVREASRDVPGWAHFEQQDPGISAEFLEDRVSVVFWRWQELLWKQKQDGWFEDAAVGTVVAVALEEDEPQDRAHVIVRWSGGGSPRQHVFVLARKHGVKTDARAGLRSARCAGCGAAPIEREAPKCEYCGADFSDGSRHWVAIEIVPAAAWKRPSTFSKTLAGQVAPAPNSAECWTAALSPRDAFCVLAAGVAADGKITPEEERYLEQFAAKKGIPADNIKALVGAARSGLIEAPKPQTPAEAKAVLRGLVEMSLADGRIEQGEREALMRYGRNANLSVEQVDKLVEDERARLYARAKEGLIANG